MRRLALLSLACSSAFGLPALPADLSMNSLMPYALPANVSAAIVAQYNIDSESTKSFINSVPVFGGETAFEPDNSAYLQKRGMSAIFGAAGAVVSFIALVLTLILRCCPCFRCRCCGKRPKTRNACLYPGSALFVFALAIAVLGSVSLAYESQLHNAIVGDKDEKPEPRPTPTPAEPVPAAAISSFSLGPNPNVFGIVVTLYSELNFRFLALQASLSNITQSVVPIANSVNSTLGDVSFIQTGTNGVITDLTQFVADHGSVSIPVSYCGGTLMGNITCDSCNDISSQGQSSINNIQQQSNATFADLNDVVMSTQQTLLDVNQTIQDDTAQAANEMTSVNSKVDSFNPDNSEDQVRKYEGYRHSIVIAFYCMCYVPLILFLLSLWRKSKWLLASTLYFLWFMAFLMFIVVAILLPSALISSDACLYLNQKEGELDTVFSGKTLDVTVACMLNTSVGDALGFSDALSFRDEIVFPTFQPVDEIFNFTALDTLTAQINNLSLASYGADDATIDAAIDEINTAGNFMCDQTNLCSCASSNTNLDAQAKELDKALQARAAISAEIADAQSDIGAINAEVTNLKMQTATLINSLNSTQTLIDPLFNTAESALVLTNCYFAGQSYREAKQQLCVKSLSAFQVLAATSFAVGLISWFAAICCWIASWYWPLWKQYPELFDPLCNSDPLKDDEFVQAFEDHLSDGTGGDRTNDKRSVVPYEGEQL